MIGSAKLGVALAVGMLIMSSAGAVAQTRLQVVTTSADLKALAQAVGGDGIDVESLAQPEQDPHTIEVKPTQIARLRSAALLVRIGLDHEPWLARLPLRQVRMVDASKSVPLLQTVTPRLRAERRAHVHAHGNTHYWLDPRNARPITATIADALAGIDPSRKEATQARREAFLARLDERIAAWEAAMRPHRGTRVLVMHDSWSYLAEWLGLEILAAVEPHPGIPPSPAEVAALLKRLRETQVRLLIAEPHANASLVRQISQQGGVRAIVLQPSGFDYIALFEDNLKRLLEALKKD